MSSGADPVDTLVVIGGRTVAHVDAEAVALAAARLDDAAAGLRAASFRCAGAADLLEHSVWAPDPFSASDAGGLAARRHAAALAAQLARNLGERADTCSGLSTRIRRAAGLYRHTESLAERVAGGIVAVGSGGLVLGTRLWLRQSSWAPLALAGGAVGTAVTLSLLRPSDAMIEEIIRGAAPFTDEAVAGLGFGVAVGSPVRSRLDASVTGGARVLSSLVHDLLPRSVVTVLPMAGTIEPPRWTETPSGNVAEALARTADLYPWGSGIDGRPAPGLPKATLAVERVRHDDGSISWTVLIPGTQSPVPPDHPFDAMTDLDLMAHEAADVGVAVEQALSQAGAGADEPVVLVGHSLGGIAAMALAASPGFNRRHRLGGVVTAGSPTATFAAPRGVPVLHLEADEELVSQLDGRSSAENPRTPDRVTVGRLLRESSSTTDQEASGSIVQAHGMGTHLRTLELAHSSGSEQVADVVGRLDALLDGERARSRFFTARREFDVDEPVVLAPGELPLSPSSGRTAR